LDASFQNKPEPWDQEVIDPKQPVGVWLKHSYPTVPMYSHAANFARFDLETLFFAFYYQQETYQQYLAAVELKKENWLFNKRFETWFKKVDGNQPSTGN
jgi:CCR4-NOT transcription complex subunit 3